jgi:integrase
MIRRRDDVPRWLDEAKTVENPRYRGDGAWQIRLDLKRKDGRRQQVYRWFTGTLAGARKEERRLLAEVEAGKVKASNKTTLRAYLPQWLASVRPDLARTTAARYEALINAHILPRLGDRRLDELARAAIRSAWATARESGRLRPIGGGQEARRGLSGATIRQMHRILHQALELAVEDEVIAANPASGIALPKAAKFKPRVLTLDESKALLEAIAHTAMQVPAMLALWCGLRRGEVLALRWRDVDLDARRLTVNRSLEQVGREVAFKAPKGDRSRMVIMPAAVAERLRAHRAEQAALRLRVGLGRDDDTLVVSKPDGNPVRPRTLTIEFARLMSRVKDVPRVRFHDLRHGFVTLQIQLGVPVKVVSERAGHSSAAFTMDFYGHVLDEMQADAAERLDAAIRRAPKKNGDG